MDQEIKARWLAALRKEGAKQATGILGRVDGSRCCLGVLCDIAGEDGVITTGTMAAPSELSDKPRGLWYEDQTAILPYAVQRWAGLDSADPHTTVSHGECGCDEPCDHEESFMTLSMLNDTALWDFPKIANQIEQDF